MESLGVGRPRGKIRGTRCEVLQWLRGAPQALRGGPLRWLLAGLAACAARPCTQGATSDAEHWAALCLCLAVKHERAAPLCEGQGPSPPAGPGLELQAQGRLLLLEAHHLLRASALQRAQREAARSPTRGARYLQDSTERMTRSEHAADAV